LRSGGEVSSPKQASSASAYGYQQPVRHPEYVSVCLAVVGALKLINAICIPKTRFHSAQSKRIFLVQRFRVPKHSILRRLSQESCVRSSSIRPQAYWRIWQRRVLL